MPTVTRDTTFSKRITIPTSFTGVLKINGRYYDGFLYYWKLNTTKRVNGLTTANYTLQRLDLTSANRPNLPQNGTPINLNSTGAGFVPYINYDIANDKLYICLLYTSPSPRDS